MTAIDRAKQEALKNTWENNFIDRYTQIAYNPKNKKYIVMLGNRKTGKHLHKEFKSINSAKIYAKSYRKKFKVK